MSGQSEGPMNLADTRKMREVKIRGGMGRGSKTRGERMEGEREGKFGLLLEGQRETRRLDEGGNMAGGERAYSTPHNPPPLQKITARSEF